MSEKKYNMLSFGFKVEELGTYRTHLTDKLDDSGSGVIIIEDPNGRELFFIDLHKGTLNINSMGDTRFKKTTHSPGDYIRYRMTNKNVVNYKELKKLPPHTKVFWKDEKYEAWELILVLNTTYNDRQIEEALYQDRVQVVE